MIKKIEELGDLSNFQVGTILTKYPISGEFTDIVDFSDNSNLLEYEVHNINPGTQMIALKIPDKNLPSPSEAVETVVVMSPDSTPPLLTKTFEDLITDKNWWYEQ